MHQFYYKCVDCNRQLTFIHDDMLEVQVISIRCHNCKNTIRAGDLTLLTKKTGKVSQREEIKQEGNRDDNPFFKQLDKEVFRL